MVLTPAKITTVTCLCLALVVLAGFAIGAGPTQTRWGEPGLRSMYSIGMICLASALLAALPLTLVSVRWPSFIGQAAMAATVIRLLFTMGAVVIYQMIAKPDLPSFLFWAVVFYCSLLVVETISAVLLVRRCYPQHKGPSA